MQRIPWPMIRDSAMIISWYVIVTGLFTLQVHAAGPHVFGEFVEQLENRR